MNCEKETCNGHLQISAKGDFRDDWSDEFYMCNKCKTEYVLHTQYKNKIIDKQTLLISK